MINNVIQFTEDYWIDTRRLRGIWIDETGTVGIEVKSGLGSSRALLVHLTDEETAKKHVKQFLENIKHHISIKCFNDNHWVDIDEIEVIHIESSGYVGIHFGSSGTRHIRFPNEVDAKTHVMHFMENNKRKEE